MAIPATKREPKAMNGVDTPKLLATVNAVRESPELARFTWRASNRWIAGTHSVSAGLDYPGVGPEHAYLKDTGRVRYEYVVDTAVLDAFFELTHAEGIMPALEPAHALAWVRANPHPGVTLVTLSGRGDKDIHTVATASGHEEFLA